MEGDISQEDLEEIKKDMDITDGINKLKFCLSAQIVLLNNIFSQGNESVNYIVDENTVLSIKIKHILDIDKDSKALMLPIKDLIDDDIKKYINN